MSRLKGKARVRNNKKKKNKSKNDYFLRRKGLLSKIKKYDDVALKVKCLEVKLNDDVKDSISKMKRVLGVTENGVGLAASQVGIATRIILIRKDVKDRDMTVMINPEIISHSEEMKFGREGCLSFPSTFAYVERYTSIKVKYLDEEMKEQEREYKEGDILGIIVQHEIEHLDGKCALYDWWKNPEEKQKELEERFKKQEEVQEVQESSSGYEIEESEDRKREKEEAEANE
jgi:peptide deformylase